MINSQTKIERFELEKTFTTRLIEDMVVIKDSLVDNATTLGNDIVYNQQDDVVIVKPDLYIDARTKHINNLDYGEDIQNNMQNTSSFISSGNDNEVLETAKLIDPFDDVFDNSQESEVDNTKFAKMIKKYKSVKTILIEMEKKDNNVYNTLLKKLGNVKLEELSNVSGKNTFFTSREKQAISDQTWANLDTILKNTATPPKPIVPEDNDIPGPVEESNKMPLPNTQQPDPVEPAPKTYHGIMVRR